MFLEVPHDSSNRVRGLEKNTSLCEQTTNEKARGSSITSLVDIPASSFRSEKRACWTPSVYTSMLSAVKKAPHNDDITTGAVVQPR